MLGVQVDELKEMGVELMVSPYSHSVGKLSHNWPDALKNNYIATDKTGQWQPVPSAAITLCLATTVVWYGMVDVCDGWPHVAFREMVLNFLSSLWSVRMCT